MRSFLLVSSLLLFSQISWAIDLKPPKFSLGPALQIQSNHRVNNTLSQFDTENYLEFRPTGLADYKGFEINDKGLNYNVYKTTALAAYVVTNIEGESYQSTGLDERKRALFGGAGFRVYPFSLYYMSDLSGDSEGSITRAVLNLPYAKGKTLTLLTLGHSIYDSKYNQYYYGVSATEAASSAFGAFTAEKGTDTFINLKFMWQLFDKWALFTMAESREFSSEIKDSPTVETERMYTGSIGFWYDFLN